MSAPEMGALVFFLIPHETMREDKSQRLQRF